MRGTPATAVAVFVAAILLLPSAQANAFDGNASIELSKTVSATSLAPRLGLTFTVAPARAIPGDRLTYTAMLTNSGSAVGISGVFTAVSQSDIVSTVSAYYDEVEYFSGPDQKWIPFTVVSASQPGYAVFEAPPSGIPMTLQLTPVAAAGVTYPTSGDPILGTRIAKGATASWGYSASIPLTVPQETFFLDPTKAAAVRNVVHFEITPRKLQNGQPYKQRIDFTPQWRVLSAGLTNAVVTIAPPSGAATDATLGALAPGASASANATYMIPPIAPKGADESDAAYLVRLGAVASAPLVASAHGSATAADGTLIRTALPDPTASANELVPIVQLTKQGQATADAGTTARYQIGLRNAGTAEASDLAVDDVFPGGAHLATTGVPATLPADGTASAQASFDIPIAQPVGDLSDTASVTWRDANANAYGPVSAMFTTKVTSSGAGATLVLAPVTAGPNVTGTSQSFTLTARDKDGIPIPNLQVHLAIVGANATSADAPTDASGSASFSYLGANRGTDTAQATATYRGTPLGSNTATVNWIVPVATVSTTLVNGRFFHGHCCGFSATPASPVVFTQNVPNINLNPPSGTIPHLPTNVAGVFTRPMVNVTTDPAGNYTGAMTVQGRDTSGVLHQAGVGDMFEFDAVFTGSFTIATAGDLTFNFFSDDGFILGVTGGATRVSGPMLNAPPLSPFQGYPVMGAFNTPTAPVANNITVHFPGPGTYPYEIDYNECCSGQLALTLATNGTGLPPTGYLAITPTTLTNVQGANQTVKVAAMDGSGTAVAGLSVTLNVIGANPGQFTSTTDSSGLAAFTLSGANPGVDSLSAAAMVSGVPEVSNEATLTWTPAPPRPSITAPSPADGTLVTAPVAIRASFAAPPGETLASWQVTYQALDPGPVVLLASGAGTPPSPLATFDPTVLPNDTYAINISATASGGGVQTVSSTVVVFGSLKPGRYVTSYQDLDSPVQGFRMQVRRTYDSFDKTQGDFGVGWSASLSNFRISANHTIGAGGWIQYNTQCFFGLCLTAFRNLAPRYVTIVFPDQHSEIFDASADGGTNIFFSGSPVFTARAGTGTTSKLVAAGDFDTDPTHLSGISLNYNGDGNIYDGSGRIFDPRRFQLTTLDGTVLLLDRTQGLIAMADRHGNRLSVSAVGVTSSTGPSIAYTRDGSGRITQVNGPGGQVVRYAYSAAGDLVSVTDLNGNLTTFAYDSSHDLQSATGPGGPLQTQRYDSAGRLVAVTDANGNTTQIANDVAGRKITEVDPTGRLTKVFTLDDLGDVVREDQVFDGTTLTTTATYDAVGRPLSRTDPLGRTWSAAYDASGNLVSLTDPAGHTVAVSYDAFGSPLAFTDALGNPTHFAYDAAGNLTSLTNALGQTDTYTYDGAGFRASRTDALGRTTSFNPDGAGNLNAIRDPLGNTARYTYDATGRLTSIADAFGQVTSYTYDAAGNLLSMRDPLGSTTTLVYDALNDLVSSTDALGKTTTFTYDANRALLSVTDPLGGRATYVYDAGARLVSKTDPAGGITRYAYDGAGRLVSLTDALGRVTSYVYDAGGRVASKRLPNGGVYAYAYTPGGRLTSITDPLGHTSTSTYDVAGRLIAVTDPLGNATGYTLDALGRQLSVQDALGHTSSTTYDAVGQVVSATDPAGAVTSYAYDAAGNRTSVTDPLGHTTAYQFDAAGRVIQATDPLGRFVRDTYDAAGRLNSTRLFSGITSTYAYDALGRRTSTTDGLGHTTSATYDALGRLASDTDANGHTTTYAYDPGGRLAAVTDALGGTAAIAYDAAGERVSVANPRGDTTRFTYDSLGNVATQTDPAGGVAAFTYDAAGRVVTKTDARGTLVSNSYDAADRLIGVTFPGGTNAFAYDSAGRRTSMTDATGTTAFAYDAAGRLLTAGGISFAYDASGRRTSIALPGARTVTYAYDAADQVTALTDWLGQTFTFGYTADGQLASVLRPSGVQSSYTYDGADRLVSISHDGASGNLARFSYTLDAVGNRVAAASAAGTESYVLDALERLTRAVYPNGDVTTYSYDAAGNRLSQAVNGTTTTYAYDAAGRLVTAGGTAYAYDAAGNLVSAGADHFAWDWAGRLNSATVGGFTTGYVYDADGVRVAATNGSNVTSYRYDRSSALATLVDDGSSGYVWAPSGLLETAGASVASLALTDALGSVRAQVSGGAVVTTSDYDVFGAARSAVPAGAIAFAGEQRDTTGLYNLRAREYQPSLGRFLSADMLLPAGPGTQGYNRYAYVGNDPTTKVDPSGRQAFVESRLVRIIATAYVAASLTLVFRDQLTRSLAALVEVLEPPVEQAVDDADQALRDWFNQHWNKPEPEPTPKPIPCIPGLPPCNVPGPTPRADDPCPITGQPTPAMRIGGVPVLCVYLHRTAAIYANDSSAQISGFPGQPPAALHFESSQTAQEANRSAALRGEPTCESSHETRDEYPYASSKEGGTNTGRKAQVRCVPRTEQDTQSRDLRVFYGVELSRVDRAPFYVMPVPY